MMLIVLLLIAVCLCEEETLVWCNPPDPVYANGVSSTAFGANGWNYVNMKNWSSIVVTCGGSQQSPINIDTTLTTTLKESVIPVIDYVTKPSSTPYIEVNLPYTKELEGEFSALNGVDYLLGVEYVAKQFHIHSPSEHTIDGKYYDLELHVVHQAIEKEEQDCNDIHNKLAVIGLLFNANTLAADLPVFDIFFDANPTGTIQDFDLNAFFKLLNDQTYYHYNGSLTTPPCSQTVNWYVFPYPIQISTKQLASFKTQFSNSALFGASLSNNRNIQNLNGRRIYKGVAEVASVANLTTTEESTASYAMVIWGFIALMNIFY